MPTLQEEAIEMPAKSGLNRAYGLDRCRDSGRQELRAALLRPIL
jgi:hypothetical protein